ncbi:thiosulfate sulfurtransferase [Amylibacter marinus]|uniref:Thiosulfate sulfurtransferase n=1 Tax=Amylibacter marinus TaxID=1475483 RepID=A0ABQ5VWT0_9RHOB|nr:3-mercaptopyruvate sulfurtransferase [Amylibacter marinus]GLQ35725.1 thiosulfate sulfurtransferase [Amylibacter marinus]
MKISQSPQWLAANLDHVKILDASWYLPSDQRDCRAEFHAQHIPNAQFFDIDAIADHDSDLPHMLPTSDAFATAVGAMGISNTDTVIVYDTAGLFSAARVWWMFRAMGHEQVYVLEGGMPQWLAQGHPIATTPSTPTPAKYHATLNPNRVVNAQQVLTTKTQIADARPNARFLGQAPEPRPNTRSGHIPNSKNLFFKLLLDAQGRLLPEAELRKQFQNADLDPEQPIITSCGSGVTAAILAMALARLGNTETSLYDGSWSEWGARDDLPIATD